MVKTRTPKWSQHWQPENNTKEIKDKIEALKTNGGLCNKQKNKGKTIT